MTKSITCTVTLRPQQVLDSENDPLGVLTVLRDADWGTTEEKKGSLAEFEMELFGGEILQQLGNLAIRVYLLSYLPEGCLLEFHNPAYAIVTIFVPSSQIISLSNNDFDAWVETAIDAVDELEA